MNPQHTKKANSNLNLYSYITRIPQRNWNRNEQLSR